MEETLHQNKEAGSSGFRNERVHSCGAFNIDIPKFAIRKRKNRPFWKP